MPVGVGVVERAGGLNTFAPVNSGISSSPLHIRHCDVLLIMDSVKKILESVRGIFRRLRFGSVTSEFNNEDAVGDVLGVGTGDDLVSDSGEGIIAFWDGRVVHAPTKACGEG